MVIKKWALGLTQPQKLAQEVRIVQDHIKNPIFLPIAGVGLLTHTALTLKAGHLKCGQFHMRGQDR